MNATKQDYLTTIRSNTAYPVYRAMIGIIALLGYILVGLQALAALIAGIGSMRSSFFAGLGILIAGFILAALGYFIIRFFKEAALILADLGDSVTEANARPQPDQQV